MHDARAHTEHVCHISGSSSSSTSAVLLSVPSALYASTPSPNRSCVCGFSCTPGTCPKTLLSLQPRLSVQRSTCLITQSMTQSHTQMACAGAFAVRGDATAAAAAAHLALGEMPDTPPAALAPPPIASMLWKGCRSPGSVMHNTRTGMYMPRLSTLIAHATLLWWLWCCMMHACMQAGLATDRAQDRGLRTGLESLPQRSPAEWQR